MRQRIECGHSASLLGSLARGIYPGLTLPGVEVAVGDDVKVKPRRGHWYGTSQYVPLQPVAAVGAAALEVDTGLVLKT